MTGESAFQKALMQADRGDVPAAEATLRALLADAPPSTLRVRALVVLGDLLASHDDAGFRDVLMEAITTAAQVEGADDLLDHELDRATELLA